MGELDRYSEYKLKKTWSFNSEDAVVQLIYLNVIFFVILLFIQVGFLFGDKQLQDFYDVIISNLAVPNSPKAFLYKPWTILIYGFTDIGAHLFRVLSNLVWLYFFGKILELTIGNSRIIAVYIYGTLAGGLIFFLISGLLPGTGFQWSNLFGAHNGIMAIAIAATILLPKYKLFPEIRGGISLWIVTFIYLLIQFGTLGEAGQGYLISLLGAAIMGAAFALFYLKDIDLTKGMTNIFHFCKNIFRQPKLTVPREKVYYKTGNRRPFDKEPILTQQKIDAILDKINESGYESLTAKEKQILQQQSRNNNE